MDGIYYKIYWPNGIGDDQLAFNWSVGRRSVLELIKDASDEGVQENAHIIMDGYEEVPYKVVEHYRHLAQPKPVGKNVWCSKILDRAEWPGSGSKGTFFTLRIERLGD